MKRYLIPLLIFAAPCMADDWALTDPTLGWNTEELATHYHHNSELQAQWAYSVIGKSPLSSTDRVLDFGSGDGKLSALLSRMAHQGEVVGIDISANMVALASQLFPYPNLRFIHSDEIDFSPEQITKGFDRITSFCAFHLLPHPDKTLATLCQVLKTEGRLTATWPITAQPEFVSAVRDEMAARGLFLPASTASSQQMRDPDQIPTLFEQAGFTIERFEVVTATTRFTSEDALVAWLQGTCAAQWNIATEQQLPFCKSLVRRYLDYAPDCRSEGGIVSLPAVRAEIVARRS